jgi:carbon-monoxide dehydrogenase medium subunit
MKPPPFGYSAPETVAEALAELGRVAEDGKVLAGGQSLVPILNMRLAAPAHLVDINGVRELAYVRPDEAGVRVGALARHAELLRHEGARRVLPLLGQALSLVAHPAIRNRGTTVGSLAHADPSGEMTAVLALTAGCVEVHGQSGSRTVPAAEFFVGPLESAVQPGELAVCAYFPALPPGTGTAFLEVARRHGDYAVCGLAAAVTVIDGAVSRAWAAYISVAPTPLVLDLTEAVRGQAGPDADWAAAGELARAQVEPEPDIHATADYRRHLAAVLTTRALREAAGRAA